jgi:hypothetical protein
MPDNDDDPGPDQALAREARPLRQWLVRYFRKRVGDAADVEDMVQEVFALSIPSCTPSRTSTPSGCSAAGRI